jgi:hypothetical protein
MAENGTVNTNRQHKSSVFADFFKERGAGVCLRCTAL